MDELKDIAEWLRAERGNWTQIAKRSGVCTRVMHRIVNFGHSPTLRTLNRLSRERAAMDALRKFEFEYRAQSAAA